MYVTRYHFWIIFFVLLTFTTGALGTVPHFKDVTSKHSLTYESYGGTIRSQLATSVVDNDGVYVADVNNNGWPDVLALGGTTPRLFKNQEGTFSSASDFPDINKKINAATFVDLYGNGYRDLVLVPQAGSPEIFTNHSGKFQKFKKLNQVELDAGIGVVTGDFFENGCADIFILQYGPGSETDAQRQRLYRRGGNYRTFDNDNAFRNLMFKNDCNNLTLLEDSIFNRTHWSLAGSGFDANDDGRMDLHVANDFYRDSLYINKGNGEFKHRYLNRSTDRNGMSSQVTDFNRDGLPDLFVSNMYLSKQTRLFDRRYFRTIISEAPHGHNALVNQGNGRFKDRAGKYQLQKGGWGWAASWGDFNGDFSPELIQVLQDHFAVSETLSQLDLNKFSERAINTITKDQIPSLNSPHSSVLRKEFQYWMGSPSIWTLSAEEVFKHHFGEDVGLPTMNGRGVSSLDFDRDGDLDLVVSQYDGSLKLFENTTNEKSNGRKHWVRFSVDRPELGGEIISFKTNGDSYPIHITSRTDFSSQEPAMYLLGLKNQNHLDKVIVFRKGRKIAQLRDVPSRSTVMVKVNSAHIKKP